MIDENKKWYELTFKPLQPLHIGIGNYGVLSPTRLFITGAVMWGALTAEYGKQQRWDIFNLEEEQKEKQKNLFLNISNFYPVVIKDEEKPLLPEYKEGELYLGKYSEKEFRYKFTHTMMSTAISPEKRAAKDEFLHEMEVILPASKDDLKEELLWKGILYIDLEKEKIKEFIKSKSLTIFVGGERTYGLGMMELQDYKEIKDNKKLLNWNLNKNNENVFILKKSSLSSHFVEVKDDLQILKGVRETLCEIDNSKSNDGFNLNLKYVYQPGCEIEQNFKLEKGILFR